MIEVELKFAVPEGYDLPAALRRHCGPIVSVPSDEADQYFQHPSRDFEDTDEALRIRRSGDQISLTWKGPRLDPFSKTREEREVAFVTAFPEQSESDLRGILEALGFSSAGRVHKHRESYDVEWNGERLTASLDLVTGLAPYLELEIVCDETQRDRATTTLLQFAQTLGLSSTERRSYLELLEQQSTEPPQ